MSGTTARGSEHKTKMWLALRPKRKLVLATLFLLAVMAPAGSPRFNPPEHVDHMTEAEITAFIQEHSQ